MPRSRRPPEIRSRVAACSASSTGLCQGNTITAEPSRSVFVRMASAMSSIKVEETWFQPVKWCSTKKLEVNPSASASTLKSSHSRKPWPVSAGRSPLLACAEVNTPNFMTGPVWRTLLRERCLQRASKPRNVGKRRAAGVHVHAAELGAAVQRREHLAGVKQTFFVKGAFEALLLIEVG